MISKREYFHQAPESPQIYYQGRIYDLAPGESEQDAAAAICQRPELLNSKEADLALVAYDPSRQSWRLLRDFGATPLYYAPTLDGFIWSFTYQGILAQLTKHEAAEDTLFDYLATHYRYIFRNPARTFHKGVFQVPAGSWVDITAQGHSEHRWLDLSPANSLNSSLASLGPQEATEAYFAILKDSLKKRLRFAKRPAFTISSGLDSSTIASLAAETLGDIDVFSVGYQGAGVDEYDESQGVALLTEGRNWRWTHLLLEEPDLVAETKNLISLSKSPIVTVTWLSYYLMARQLTDFSEIFTGLGGDESLAGEFVHFFYFFADLEKSGNQGRLASEVKGWSHLHDHPVFKKNPAVLKDFWARNINFQTGEMAVDRQVYQNNWRFFNPEWLESFGSENPPMVRPYESFLSNRLYQEIFYETTPPTLWGLFMANQVLGLRGVSPFISPPLFKLALALPGTVKYDNGVTKALLRRALKGILPESLRTNTKKVGFNAPIHQWFRSPKVRTLTLELLKDGPLARRAWLKKGAVENIFREHETGEANHMMLLWTLLNASLFLEQS